MLQPDLQQLPTNDELLDSDDFPVDNEDQNLIPNVLSFLLEYIWKQRQNWFFAADMGVYHTTGAHPKVPVVPDGFLSLAWNVARGESRAKVMCCGKKPILPQF
jgi:Uma2 family endonuclease